MTMKNQRNFWQTMKRHGKRLVTSSLLAGTLVLPLVLPWHAAEADPLSVVEFTCAGYGYSVLTIGAADDGYPQGVARIMCRMSVYSLQTNTFTPTFLQQPAPAFSNTYEPRLAVDDEGFLPVLSW